MIPTTTTERLLLRPPRAEDFEPYATFFASDRAVWEDGPLSRQDAWSEFATAAGAWVLRGFGSLSIADRANGAYLGEVGLYQPDHYPDRLRARAVERFEPASLGGTDRTVEGELTVKLFMAGRTVERALVSGLQDWLVNETVAVDRWIADGMPTAPERD